MNAAFLYVFTTNGLLFLISIIFWKFPPKKSIVFMAIEPQKQFKIKKYGILPTPLLIAVY